MKTYDLALKKLLAATLVLLLSACSVKSTIVATSTTAPDVTHLYVTVSAVWLNPSASAQAGDGSWTRVTLNKPVTVDLYDPTHYTLRTIISNANLPAGTYAQMRWLLVSNSAALANSASSLGLAYNNLVEFNSANSTQTVPLEFPTQAQSLLIPSDVVISGSASSGQSVVHTLVLSLDALRHVNYLTQTFANGSKQTFAMLSAPASALLATKSGAISGSLDLSSIDTAVLGSQGLIATAQVLAADGSRHIAVGSAVVQVSGTTGTFTLYPLPLSSSGTTTYDVVIHGPGVAPILIQSVPASAGSTGTSIQSQSLAVQPASVYSVTMPRVTTNAAGQVFTGNSQANTLPAGADVGFFETIRSASPAPYLIESASLNPLTRQFSATDSTDPIVSDTAWLLSNSPVWVGAYNGGSAITLTNAVPAEGAGAYLVAASAPLYTDGALTLRVNPIATTATPTPLYPAVPVSASGIVTNVAVTLLPSTLRYDRGTLLFSAGGKVVQAVDLAAALLAGAGDAPITVTVYGVPTGGLSGSYRSAVYDVEARVWNSGNPSQAVRYSWISGVDLSSGLTSTLSLNLP